MLDVRGFRGLRFVPEKTGSLDHVITPPYDVISPEQRERLAAESPYNMVHLMLPVERDGLSKYEAAADSLKQWPTAGILVQDDEPSFYLVRQRFKGIESTPYTRRGFFALVKLPETGERAILGHERTFPKPVEDRLALLQATRADLEPVFGLYKDPDRKLGPFLDQMNARPEVVAKTMDGARVEVWRVPEDEAVMEFFRNQTIYIADGHHRFRTACLYRDQMRQTQSPKKPQPYDFVMMGLVALTDPGLRIYPTHRLIPKPDGFDAAAFLRALKKWFEVEKEDGDLAVTVRRKRARCALGVSIHGKGDYLLTLKDVDRVEFLGDDHGPAWRDLDVAVLHRGILEQVLGISKGTVLTYEYEARRAVDAVHSGEAGVAFILRATRPDQVCACAEAAEPMPQKSTYFFPKLPSGGVIYRF